MLFAAVHEVLCEESCHLRMDVTASAGHGANRSDKLLGG